MYTYKGEEFLVKDIIGQFEKDPESKLIKLIVKDGKAYDMQGRLVNAAGYLIDQQGNIVNGKAG